MSTLCAQSQISRGTKVANPSLQSYLPSAQRIAALIYVADPSVLSNCSEMEVDSSRDFIRFHELVNGHILS